MLGLRRSLPLVLAVAFAVIGVHPLFADDDDDKKDKKRRKDMMELAYVEKALVGLPPGLKAIAFIPFSQAIQDKEGVFSAREKKMGDEITAAIAQRMQEVSRQFNIPLNIVDRESVAAIMKEKDLADAGLTQEDKALQLGKLANAQAICYGRMSIDVHKEEGVSKTFRPVFSTGERVTVHRDPYRPHRRVITREPTINGGIQSEPVRQIRRTITVSATVKLVSIATGKSIVTFNRRLMETAERKPSLFMGEDAQEIQLRPEDETIERLFNAMVDEFVAQLLPHEVRFEVKVAGPKAKLAKTAAKFLQAGNYDKAIELFRESLESKPDDHAAHYDLGIAYEISGQPKKALECYERAYSLKDQDIYLEAVQRIRPRIQAASGEVQKAPAENKPAPEPATDEDGNTDPSAASLR